MLYWSARHNICCFLDNHQYHLTAQRYECLVAAGCHDRLEANAGQALQQLQLFVQQQQDWCFGHLGYDIKDEIEALHSSNPDPLGFPDLHFFVPEVVLMLQKDELVIGAFGQHQQILDQILHTPAPSHIGTQQVLDIRQRFSKEEYLSRLEKIKEHILRGDCYEINFCQEFYNEHATIDPLSLYISLCRESPNPYACFYRIGSRYLLCASPERYINRQGNRILSQPIKGTAARHREDPGADLASRQSLQHSVKDRSENVMVVDLVRNDLSKVSRKGSVKVEELFGIYDFPQVYQMVSTISGELKPYTTIADIFRASFPMASMTGVPKKRVMELIDRYEAVKRGLYSGTTGYITPNGDFDFNVVIRSILYNAGTRYLSFQTGSAITFNSDPVAEYEECLLKAMAIKKVLNG